jgi:hypothetical protein
LFYSSVSWKRALQREQEGGASCYVRVTAHARTATSSVLLASVKPRILGACVRISDKALDELIELCKEDLDHEIDRAEASEMAFRIITL